MEKYQSMEREWVRSAKDDWLAFACHRFFSTVVRNGGGDRRLHWADIESFEWLQCRYSLPTIDLLFCGVIRMKRKQLHRSKLLYLIIALLVSFAIPEQTSAQGPSGRYSQIIGDSVSITSIDVAALRNRKDLQLVPWEIISAYGIQELGVDPLLIESIDITAGVPTLNGPEFGGVIRTVQPVDIANLSENLFGETVESPKIKGLRFRDAHQAPVKLAQSEKQVVLFGTEGSLRTMLGKPSKGSKMVELVKASKFPLRSVTSVGSIRPVLEGALAEKESAIPPALYKDLEVILEELEYVFTGNDMVGIGAEIDVRLVAKDSASAAKLMAALDHLRTNGLGIAEQSLREAIDQDQSMTPELKSACVQYLERLKLFLAQADLWKVEGEQVAINGTYSYSVPTIGVLTGLLLPAVQSARNAAQRMQSSNNIKQILLSIHNYESTYKRFPARTINSKDGKPLLSWRVSLLPYVEEAGLYQEFHLDEPWDSPHNIKLLDRMPLSYKHPNSRARKGHTVYVAPFRKDTVWNLEKARFQNITDGTANTIAIVEVEDEYAVPWTKPEDLDLNQRENFTLLRGPSFQAGMFDGSVRAIAKDTDAEILEALITSQGGEPVAIP